MRRVLLSTATVAAVAVTATVLAAPLTASAAPAASSTAASSTGALQAVGLSGGGKLLYRFSTADPGSVTKLGVLRGLVTDTRLVGIDFRVADGGLYGLGDRGGIYRIDAAASRSTLFGRLTVPLEGTMFGVDVNPAADALRVVSDTGQNLRQSFATPAGPTAVDGRLTTPPTAGDTTGITGAAYTNNDADPDTATTLFDISSSTDNVFVQAPANVGTLSPTGNLTRNAIGNVGFDIYSVLDGGTSVDSRAFASLNVGGQRGLYSINLLNGRATSLGALGGDVVDLAFPLAQG